MRLVLLLAAPCGASPTADLEQWQTLVRQDPAAALEHLQQAPDAALSPMLRARLSCEAQRDLGRFQQALAAASPYLDKVDQRQPELVPLWYCAGFAADTLGDDLTAARYYEIGRALAAQLGDGEGEARGYYAQALIASQQGRPLAAMVALRAARQKMPANGDPRVRAGVSYQYGELLLAAGANSDALRAYEDAVSQAERINDTASLLPALEGLARAHIHAGNYPLANEVLVRLLALSRQHQRVDVEALVQLGQLRLALASSSDSQQLERVLLPLVAQLLDAGARVDAELLLARAALVRGDLATASSRLQQARLSHAASASWVTDPAPQLQQLSAALAAANGQWQSAYEQQLAATEIGDQQRQRQLQQLMMEFHHQQQMAPLPQLRPATDSSVLVQQLEAKSAALRLMHLSMGVTVLALLPILALVYWLGRRRGQVLAQPL
ncbi:MAG: hypothetical protein II007_06500 [Gammaproteobacteria bacterium]|nr:hypothetical protein [Gammaproteobacteria bacterium]